MDWRKVKEKESWNGSGMRGIYGIWGKNREMEDGKYTE